MLKGIFPYFLLLFAVSNPILSQYPFVQVISHEKGFGNSTISKLVEDHQGVIWAATELGLLRFDGLLTTVHLPKKGEPNSLSNEYIYDIFEDRNHYLWVATRNGLNSIDPSRKKFKRYFHDNADETTIPNNRIFQLAPDSDSTFFIVCDQSSLASFNQNTGKVKRLNPSVDSELYADRSGEVEVLEVFVSFDDLIYMRSNKGFLQYNRKENVIVDVQDKRTGIRDIIYYGNHCISQVGIMWFSDRNEILYKWKPGHYLIPIRHPQLSAGFRAGQFTITEYNHDYMLISTVNDYILVDKNTNQTHSLVFREDQARILTYGQITDCLETSKGIVAMGSARGNLYLIDPLLQQFRYRNILNEYTRTDDPVRISDSYSDPKYGKRYFSAVQDSFFYVEDLTTNEVKAFSKPAVSNIANNWTLDQSGRLWLSDGSGVLEVNRSDQSYIRHSPSTPVSNLFDMIEISPGKMWISSLRQGFYHFEPDKKIFEKIPEGKGWTDTRVYCFKMDKKHQSVWIGTVNEGAYRYDIARDTFYHYLPEFNNPHSLGGDFIKDITIDSTGKVWFSTEPVGLSVFDFNAHPDSAFINLSREDGLPTNSIAGLGTDQQGRIWMSSLNGIAYLQPSDFSIKLFSKSDGLPETKFARPNLNISSDNLVIIHTRRGYFYFNPDSLIINREPPGLVITDVLVNDQSKLNLKEGKNFLPVRLKFKENYLTIQFSVINFTEPQLNEVRYMMEGLDEQWNVRSGISQVSYTKVPPGEYTFRILAANNDGVWNEQESILPIIIVPPFWQRTWFYILIGCLVSGIVFAFYSYKLKQSIREKLLIAEQERIKSESERQLGQLEMKALRAQMNPHFIFNCLNSINRFIVVNDNDTASEYLTKFSRLIRQVLENSRGEKIGLTTEIETLTLYIEMESLRFANKFEYSITLDPDLDADAYIIQPMLIQPYIENAIWHGLMHRKTKGILQISFTRKENSLLVVISDNGVGREKAKSIKESQLVPRKSYGMKVTAERMSLLSKSLNVKVEANVEDLYDDLQQSTGTRVNLILPVEPISALSESPNGQ